MAAERGASRNTLAAYRRDLEQAAEWVKGPLGDADAAALRKLMAHYQPLAASSAARKLSALRQFFAFLLDEGERADNPALDIARPATRRPLPRILTHADVERLFEQAGEEAAGEAPPASAVRMLLLLELLYGSGLRASELVSLPRRAVAGEREYLIVRGKGDKERLVPLSQRARAAFDRWLPLLVDGSPWLFPSGKAHISRVRLAVPDAARTRGARRDRPDRDQPACAAPRLCDAPARRRRRSARAAIDARPRRHRDHRNLHACR